MPKQEPKNKVSEILRIGGFSFNKQVFILDLKRTEAHNKKAKYEMTGPTIILHGVSLDGHSDIIELSTYCEVIDESQLPNKVKKDLSKVKGEVEIIPPKVNPIKEVKPKVQVTKEAIPKGKKKEVKKKK